METKRMGTVVSFYRMTQSFLNFLHFFPHKSTVCWKLAVSAPYPQQPLKEKQKKSPSSLLYRRKTSNQRTCQHANHPNIFDFATNTENKAECATLTRLQYATAPNLESIPAVLTWHQWEWQYSRSFKKSQFYLFLFIFIHIERWREGLMPRIFGDQKAVLNCIIWATNGSIRVRILLMMHHFQT